MDITKIMKPNKNNVILAIILFFLVSIPTYEISTPGIFKIFELFVQTQNFGNGLPLPYLISTARTVFFFLPGGNVVNINYVNLFVDILFWFIISSFIAWKYFRGKKK